MNEQSVLMCEATRESLTSIIASLLDDLNVRLGGTSDDLASIADKLLSPAVKEANDSEKAGIPIGALEEIRCKIVLSLGYAENINVTKNRLSSI